MRLISPEYLALQRELHSRGKYGVTMPRHASEIRAAMRGAGPIVTILDYGCGANEHARKIFDGEFDVYSYDPCLPGLDKEPPPCDFLICTDVLEHVEPDLIDDVLFDMQGKMLKAGYLSISLRPAKKLLADGSNAHILLRKPAWWLTKLQSYFIITNFSGNSEIEMTVHIRR